MFKSEENYDFFLNKYQRYFSDKAKTLVYYLMPTHFHFLVFIKSSETAIIKNNFCVLLSSYAKAIKNRYKRHCSFFQLYTILVDSDYYLICINGVYSLKPYTCRINK